ncbi:LTA synthase family protein [Rufibacter sp. LB8]|uniref:LTA synthase family protein n=1 Tax=Rufibacter sp. LB8 TaxID=2777781 RepID=UPI00178C73AC|nr:LTA synthase family protein [Rufibacter sp. LB8]
MRNSKAGSTLAKRILLLFGVYLFLRILFLLNNSHYFSSANTWQLLRAFLWGFRFDAAALATLNAPFILFSLLPFQFVAHPKYQKALKIWFFVVNVQFLWLNVADIEYFSFVGKRTTNELFTITHDIADQAGQLLLNYWYLLFFFAFLVALLWKLYPRLSPQAPVSVKGQLILLLIMAPLTLIGIRGGIQYKPLRPSEAFNQDPAILGNLTLNSSYTFIRSLSSKKLTPSAYFKSEVALRQALGFDALHYSQPPGAPIYDNVVLLVLESFSSEYTGIENPNHQGYTPFFDSLATEGQLFRDHYANGRRSIEALPSILSGLPSLLEEPFINSAYQFDKLIGIGSLVRDYGYTTSFFHGGNNGTMNFDTFSKIAGFGFYNGLNEYPEDLKPFDYDGEWGIFDEPYLQYFARVLGKQKEPFLSTVFTLSAHHPYTIPQEHKGNFPKGPLEIHETIGYTDYALRQFFQYAKTQPWYKRTLFIITADHTQLTHDKDFNNLLGNFKVPLLFFRPGRPLPPYNPHRITQHADIPASVADVLNLPSTQILPFSRSVWDKTTPGRAVLYNNQSHYLVKQVGVAQMRQDQVKVFPYEIHYLRKQPLHNPALAQKLGGELKALLQYYQTGLQTNQLYYWQEKK